MLTTLLLSQALAAEPCTSPAFLVTSGRQRQYHFVDPAGHLLPYPDALRILGRPDEAIEWENKLRVLESQLQWMGGATPPPIAAAPNFWKLVPIDTATTMLAAYNLRIGASLAEPCTIEMWTIQVSAFSAVRNERSLSMTDLFLLPVVSPEMKVYRDALEHDYRVQTFNDQLTWGLVKTGGFTLGIAGSILVLVAFSDSIIADVRGTEYDSRFTPNDAAYGAISMLAGGGTLILGQIGGVIAEKQRNDPAFWLPGGNIPPMIDAYHTGVAAALGLTEATGATETTATPAEGTVIPAP